MDKESGVARKGRPEPPIVVLRDTTLIPVHGRGVDGLLF